MRRLLCVALLSLLLLAGCGVKGDLFLPDNAASAGATQ